MKVKTSAYDAYYDLGGNFVRANFLCVHLDLAHVTCKHGRVSSINQLIGVVVIYVQEALASFTATPQYHPSRRRKPQNASASERA